MTNEQINTSIAEACGWEDVDACTCPEICLIGLSPHGNYMHVPNYCADLNAMHEVEEALKGVQFAAYAAILGDVDGSLFGIRATARQRAEAFLRTLGKWEEGE